MNYRFLVLICGVMFPGGGSADVAQLGDVGFLNDGAKFVLEEFGYLDGSGFPYAKRSHHFAGASADSDYVVGSVVVEDHGASLETARVQAKTLLGHNSTNAEGAPGFSFNALVAYNPVTETASANQALEFTWNPATYFVDPPNSLHVHRKPIPMTETCDGLVEQTFGFQIFLTEAGSGTGDRMIYDDSNTADDRGCVLAYRIEGLFQHHTEAGQHVAAVLIGIESYGFEGPLYRRHAVVFVP